MEEKRLDASTGQKLKRLLFSYNSALIFVFLLVIASFFINRFTKNYSTIIFEASVYGLIAVGLSLVMITGNIDLSVGFQAATSAVIVVLVINNTGSVALGVVAALLTGILMGCVNGTAVTVLGISPLIGTIATNYIYKGFVYYFTKNGSIYPAGELRTALKNSFAHTQLLNMKALSLSVIVVVVIMIILAIVMKKTKFGNALYISGDNEEAGKLAGINTRRTGFMAYVLCGLLSGLAGVIMASYQGAAIYTLGEGRDVFAISACVIGGVKMAGGKGTMLNVLIGILIMRMISSAMNLMLIPTAWVDFVSGALLIVVLIIDKFTTVKTK